MRNLINITCFLPVIIFAACNNDDGIEQEYFSNCLVTTAYYNSKVVYTSYDRINLNTSDSIKCIRYNEAKIWVKKFQSIDGSNCH